MVQYLMSRLQNSAVQKYSSNRHQKVQVLRQEVLCALYLKVLVVKNVLAKSKGSSNPHNLVKATFAALLEMRDAFSIAEHRGVRMEKVFNG